MDPKEVGETYKKQAEALKVFLDKLQTEKYTNEEYKLIVITICQRYYELLVNLAAFTPLLANHQVKFYKTLQNKMDLSEPPFDKDFFNKD
jgi:hypothetical protein